MRKKRTTYDEATAIFTTVYGVPTFDEITGLWHRYASEQKKPTRED